MAEASIIEYPTTPERIDECPATPDRLINIKSPESSSSSCDDGEFYFRGRQRAGSPPPHCAICLEKCKSKCFTDSCLHQFCFKCLLEWSKIKAECPLCKQSFKSIIHNVKSIDQFEEYYVPPPESSIPVPRPIAQPIPSPPFTRIPSGRVQSGRLVGRRSSTFAQRFDVFLSDISSLGFYRLLNRNGFSATVQVRPNDSEAFHQIFLQRNNDSRTNGEEVNVNTNVNNNTAASRLRQHIQLICAMPGGSMGQMWRRFIYQKKLYALSVADITGRFRECSASFYRENPAQIHRLMPWLNRDLVALLRDTEHHVSYVLNTLSDLLTVYNINSAEFRRRCRTYLGQCTAHFIHEFLNFARSPYDMIGYDREVRYITEFCHFLNLQDAAGATENRNNVQRSVSAEVIFSSRSEFTRFMLSANSYNDDLPSYDLLNDYINSGSNDTENSAANQRLEPLINLTIESNDESNNAGDHPTQVLGQNNVIQINQNIVIDDLSSSSDECEFVMEQKPPHLRTPELVSLCTDSDDSDVIFIGESHENNNEPTTSGIISSTSSNIPTRGRRSTKNKSLIRVLSDSDSDSDTVLSQLREKVINENGTVKTEPQLIGSLHDALIPENIGNNSSNKDKTQSEKVESNVSIESTSSRNVSLKIKLPWKKQFLRRPSSRSSSTSSESSDDTTKNKKLAKRKKTIRNDIVLKKEMPDIRCGTSSAVNVGASTSKGLYNPANNSYVAKKYYARPVRQSRVKSQQTLKSIYEESSDSENESSRKKYSRAFERTDSDYNDRKSTKRRKKSSKKVKRSKSHSRKEHNNISKHRKDKRKKEKRQSQVKHKKSSRSKQKLLNKRYEYYSDSSSSSESYRSRSKSNSSESSSSTMSRSRSYSRSQSFSPASKKRSIEKIENSNKKYSE